MAKIFQFTQPTPSNEMKFDNDFDNEETDKINILNKFDIDEYISGKFKKYLTKKIRNLLEFVYYDTAFNDDERPMTTDEYEELEQLVELIEEEIQSTKREKKQTILEELFQYINIKQEYNNDKSRAFNDWRQSANEEFYDDEEAIDEYLQNVYDQYDIHGTPGIDYEDDADDNEYNYSENDNSEDNDSEDYDSENNDSEDDDNSYQF